MTYEWTDWIEHVPGQELPVGFYVLCEFVGYSRNGGEPYEKEGPITAECKGHPSWYAKTPFEKGVMIKRYKIRVEREEVDIAREQELVAP